MFIKCLAKQFNKNKELIKFGVVGISNLTLSLIAYYTLVWLGVNYQIANVVGFILGSMNGYYWNQRWVFESNRHTLKSFIKFYATYLSTWGLGAVLLFIEVDLLGYSELVVPLFNICITTPINYLMNKHWSFKKQS